MFTDAEIYKFASEHNRRVETPTRCVTGVLSFARAIESAACAPLLERIAELEFNFKDMSARRTKYLDETVELKDRIAELEAELAQRVPDGWQMVPAVPTHIMELRGSISWENNGQESPDVVEIYQVMLAAAPAAPAAPEQQEPKSPCACRPGMMCNRSATCADEIRRDAAQAPNAQQAAPSCESKTVDSDPQPSLSARGSQQEAAQQAEAQPVAEVIIGDDEFDLGLTDDYAFGKLKLPNGRHMLYTAQPKAVPLTELQRLSMEELEAIFQCGGDVYTNVQSALAAKNGMELVGAPEEKGGE